MNYPISAACASEISLSYRKQQEREREAEQDLLCQATLLTFNVYVNRASRRGYDTAVLYIPYEIRDRVISRINELGFIYLGVQGKMRPNHHLFKW